MNYLLGTKEFVPAVVTVNGAVITTAVELAMVPKGVSLPFADETWRSAYELSGQIGILLAGDEQAGIYEVYARVTDSPEIPIIDLGSFTIASQ